MKQTHTTRRSAGDSRKGKTDWQHVDGLTDEEVQEAARSDPDTQPTNAEFWTDATLRVPEKKRLISLRLDPDVIQWYKSQGRGYQTRMNAVLRQYMEAHAHEEH